MSFSFQLIKKDLPTSARLGKMSTAFHNAMRAKSPGI